MVDGEVSAIVILSMVGVSLFVRLVWVRIGLGRD